MLTLKVASAPGLALVSLTVTSRPSADEMSGKVASVCTVQKPGAPSLGCDGDDLDVARPLSDLVSCVDDKAARGYATHHRVVDGLPRLGCLGRAVKGREHDHLLVEIRN